MLEVILAIAIAGILALFVTGALVTGVTGFLSTRENLDTNQRARLALERITREVRGLTNVITASPALMAYADRDGTVRGLAYAAGAVTLDGNTLIDGLDGYAGGTSFLEYLEDDGSAWTAADPLEDLFEVRARLNVRRTGDPAVGALTLTFSATVNPRNTGAASVP